jgi:hypothetical protein
MKHLFVLVILFHFGVAQANTKVSIFMKEFELPDNCVFNYRSDSSFDFTCRAVSEDRLEGLTLSFQSALKGLEKTDIENLKNMPDDVDFKLVSSRTEQIGDFRHSIVVTKLGGFDYFKYGLCVSKLGTQCLRLSSGNLRKISDVISKFSNKSLIETL